MIAYNKIILILISQKYFLQNFELHFFLSFCFEVTTIFKDSDFIFHSSGLFLATSVLLRTWDGLPRKERYFVENILISRMFRAFFG